MIVSLMCLRLLSHRCCVRGSTKIMAIIEYSCNASSFAFPLPALASIFEESADDCAVDGGGGCSGKDSVSGSCSDEPGDSAVRVAVTNLNIETTVTR